MSSSRTKAPSILMLPTSVLAAALPNREHWPESFADRRSNDRFARIVIFRKTSGQLD